MVHVLPQLMLKESFKFNNRPHVPAVLSSSSNAKHAEAIDSLEELLQFKTIVASKAKTYTVMLYAHLHLIEYAGQ